MREFEYPRVLLPASRNRKVGIVPHYTAVEMRWEYPREFYESCVGKGWAPLLVALSNKLFYLGWDGRLLQVKEKFGTLRFYWENNIPDVLGAIADDCVSQAESRSAYICQTCGEYAETRGDGWYVTLCKKHWEEYQKR